MKRLSVIVPGYNTRKEWWVRCVNSLVKALTAEDEIIVVDDGSDVKVDGEWWAVDGGGEAVCEIKVERLEKNSGLPTARNRGMDVATGRFVTFVDSDDEIREGTYDRCIARMEETGADLAVYGIQSFFMDLGLTIRDIPEDKYYGELTPRDVAYLVKRRLFYYMCNKVFRRSFIDAHQMRVDPEGVPCEDAIFNVGCVVNRAKWVTVAFCGYKYYRYDGTIVSSYAPTLVAGQRKCSAAWKAYKDATPGAYEALGTYDERSEHEIARNQWTNIWRRRSPYTLAAKWRWLKANEQTLRFAHWPPATNHQLPATNHQPPPTSLLWRLKEFVRKGIFMFGRAHFYIKPIRKWWQVRCNERRGAKFEKIG